jgi:DNA-binding NarL/FixJ family response regulator
MPHAPSFLVVDDSASDRLLARQLIEESFPTSVIYLAADGDDAASQLKSINVDIVITDLSMPGMNGSELLEHIQKTRPLLPVVIFTAYCTEDTAVMALACLCSPKAASLATG